MISSHVSTLEASYLAAHGAARTGMRLKRLAPAASAVLVAILLRSITNLGEDCSWLLTLGEKFLAGATPYVDFIEVNPPASFLMYLPAIVLARVLGVSPESALVGLMFVAVPASLALTMRILGALRHGAGEPFFLTVAVLLLLVVPNHSFGQREHVAVVALLPILAACAARARGQEIAVGYAILAGIGGGIAIAIKPHFALALLLPLGYLALTVAGRVRQRVAAVCRAETLVTGAVLAAYTIAVLVFFRPFVTDTIPLVASMYLPLRESIAEMLVSPWTILCVAALATAWLLQPTVLRQPFAVVVLLAAGGFMLAALIQATGLPYQFYPSVALVALVSGMAASQRFFPAPAAVAARPTGLEASVLGSVFLLLMAGAPVPFAGTAEHPGLVDAIRRLAPPNPKFFLIGGDLVYGHPLNREIGGTWVGRMACLWTTDNATLFLQTPDLDPVRRTAVLAARQRDREILVEDIARNRPDVIVVENDRWHRWIAEHADVAAVLGSYREAAKPEGARILLRRDTNAFGMAASRS